MRKIKWIPLTIVISLVSISALAFIGQPTNPATENNPTPAAAADPIEEYTDEYGEFSEEDEVDSDAVNSNAVFSTGDSDAELIFAKAKKKRKSCACSSGCGVNKNGLKSKIKQLVSRASKKGIQPVSCIRSQKCQNRLRSCYERCGQKGRAAKKSKHAEGKACDFPRRTAGTLKKLASGLGLTFLYHTKREGSGLHVSQ